MNKVVKNYFYNASYQVLLVILPIIVTPYVSRVLGASGVGTYNYTNSITQFFMVFGCIGLSLYGQREVAYYQNDIEKRSKVFFEILIFRLISLSISLIIYYFCFVMNSKYASIFIIQMIDIISYIFDVSWFFQGMEEFKKTVIRNIAVRLVSVGLIFVFVKQQTDLSKYLAIYAFADLIGNLSLWLYLPKYFKGVKVKNINIIRQIPAITLLFVPQIASKIYNMLDTTMLGKIILDKAETGFYEQSQKIIRVLLTIVTSLGTVMVPRMASMFAKGEKKKINEYMTKSFNYTYLLSFPIMFGLIAISKDFVPWFFGPGYDKVVVLINIISPIILLMGISNIIGMQYLLPTKRQKEFTMSVTIGVIVNFILNFIMIKLWKSVGACIATVVSQIVVDAIQLYEVKNEINLKRMLRISYKYIFSSLIMFGICCLLILFLNGFICMVSQIIVGAVVYFGILLYFRDPFVYSLIDKVRVKILGKMKTE